MFVCYDPGNYDQLPSKITHHFTISCQPGSERETPETVRGSERATKDHQPTVQTEDTGAGKKSRPVSSSVTLWLLSLFVQSLPHPHRFITTSRYNLFSIRWPRYGVHPISMSYIFNLNISSSVAYSHNPIFTCREILIIRRPGYKGYHRVSSVEYS